jgi:hypothetical protein
MSMTRPLTHDERRLIVDIANKLGGMEGTQLLADVENATASPATPDGSRVTFEIAGYVRPKYRGQHPYRVEGLMLDGDGAELSVVLHADENGRLLELEFIRGAEGDLIAPNWNTLKLF